MQKIIYITSPTSQEIHVWKINKYFLLKSIQTLNTIEQVQPIIIHPNKKNLYVGTRLIPKIINFRIERNGTLTQESELLISGYPTHLSINQQGSCLYSVSYNNNSLDVVELNNAGNFKSILQTLTGLAGCHSSNIEIINQRLLIPCLQENCIRLYDINDLGILDIHSLKIIDTKINSGPRHMVFHHSYNYAYLINELNGTINVIEINKHTKIAPVIIQTINIIPDNMNTKIADNTYWASDIHITNDDRWLYCSERKTSTISCFKIFQQGKELQHVETKITETQPRGFAIDNQGLYLIVVGQKSNCCSVYKIDNTTGVLENFFRFPVGTGPTWINILDQ